MEYRVFHYPHFERFKNERFKNKIPHFKEFYATINERIERDFGKLTLLDLTDNNLIELPESLGNLTQLTELDLGGNQLTELYLTCNQLVELPESLGNLTQQIKLILAFNPIKHIPNLLNNPNINIEIEL